MTNEAPGDNRPIRYYDTAADGTELIVYRASGFGGCERALVAAGLDMPGVPWPASFMEVLAEGHVAEPYILAAYEALEEVDVINRQGEIELELFTNDRGQRVVVRAHMDGMTTHDAPVLVDAKKFRESTYPEFLKKGVEVHATYPWQFSAMMHGGGFETAAMVGGLWRPETRDQWGEVDVPGRLIDIAVKPISNPPIPLRAFKLRAAKIERLIEEGRDRDVVMEATCTANWPCKWTALHDDKRPDAPKVDAVKLDATADDGLRELIAEHRKVSGEYKVLKAEADALDAYRKSLGEGVRVWLDDHGRGDDKVFELDGARFIRTRSTTPARMTTEYTTDYITTAEKSASSKRKSTAAVGSRAKKGPTT